jgi:hypothetical protein
MSIRLRSLPTAALLAAALLLVHGCGKGLFDHASAAADAAVPDPDDAADTGAAPTDDLIKPPEDAVKPGNDAKPTEDAPKPPDDSMPPPPEDAKEPPAPVDSSTQVIDEVTKTIGTNGGQISIGGAVFTIGQGTFTAPTQVTIRELTGIDHTGAYGPIYEITVPAAKLFTKEGVLTMQAPNVGDNQTNLAVAILDPGLSITNQQWVPVYDSKLSDDQATLTGSVTGFGNTNVLLLGAVIRCPTSTPCPSHQLCNASACQQCPTLSYCP